MVIATSPWVYAIEPHTTKVPAEKKLINSDNPLIHAGTAPPPAKKDLMLDPVLEKDIPVANTIREKIRIVQISKESKGVLGLKSN
jgi:hypothetical protein